MDNNKNSNNKMHPVVVIIIVIIALNILGFLLELLFETAVLAAVILGIYLLYQKFIKKA